MSINYSIILFLIWAMVFHKHKGIIQKVVYMLSIEQMKDRLKQTTYKPGWEMSIYEGFSRGAMFKLVAIVDDSVNKGEKVPLEIYSAIPHRQRRVLSSLIYT